MDDQTLADIYRSLRQRAEADKILGVRAWPVSRLLLRRPAAAKRSVAPSARPVGPAQPVGAAPPGSAGARPATGARPAAPGGTALSMSGPAYRAASPATPRRAAGGGQIVQCRPHPENLTEEGRRRQHELDVINNGQVRGCRKCGLCETRTQTVFGQGNPEARIVFVGEAPGFDEDQSGFAFVGRAGQLLTDMIEKGMGLKRDDVFICNVLKCRPPENRAPALDEIAACSPYLFDQLRIIRPEVIVALGAPAAQTLLQTAESIGRLRGRFHDFYVSGAPLGTDPPIPLMPTYHPSYLLRTPSDKIKTWEDLKKVLERLGLPIPTIGSRQ